MNGMQPDEPCPTEFVEERASPLGGANPKTYLVDVQGRNWLFKPQSVTQTLIDIAAAETLRRAEITSPNVYLWPPEPEAGEVSGSVQPLLTVQAFELSRRLVELTPLQRSELQRCQVVDWLIGNPDSHRAQFLLLEDGRLAAIDRARALSYRLHQRLDWNAGAYPVCLRPSVYRYLWQGVLRGDYDVFPFVATGAAARIARALSSEELNSIWWPALSRLSGRRRLLAGTSGEAMPSASEILDTLVKRRDNLVRSFEDLYYRRSHGRWRAPGRQASTR